MNETLKKVILTTESTDEVYTWALTQKQLDLLNHLVDKGIDIVDAKIEVVSELHWVEI